MGVVGGFWGLGGMLYSSIALLMNGGVVVWYCTRALAFRAIFSHKIDYFAGSPRSTVRDFIPGS